MTWLNLLTAHLLGFALVGIFWAHRVIHPESYLFTLPLIYGVHKTFSLESLLIRAGILIVFSALAAIGLPPNVVIYASILAAIYVVWPAVLHPGELEPYVQEKRLRAYVLFLLYVGFAFAFALAGIEIRNLMVPQAKAHFAQFTKPGEVFGALLWIVIGAVLLGVLRVVGRWLRRERHLPDKS